MDLNVGLKETVMVDGAVVEKDALRIAEAVQKINPNLKVVCLDPAKAGINEAPFMVVELCVDGVWRPVFSAWQLDQRILDRIHMADRFAGNEALALVEEAEALYYKREGQRFKEEQDQRIDLVASIVRSRKSSFTFKNEEGVWVTINEHGRTTYK